MTSKGVFREGDDAPAAGAGDGARATIDDGIAALRRRPVMERLRDGSAGRRDSAADVAPAPDRGRRSDQRDGEILDFLRQFSEKKDQRKYQLSIIKDFLDDPGRFSLQDDLIPSSTSPEEFEGRKKDLTLRIKLMQALLSLAEEEYRRLLQAEAFARSGEGKSEPS